MDGSAHRCLTADRYTPKPNQRDTGTQKATQEKELTFEERVKRLEKIVLDQMK
ncbi:MAG: hypothetical protein WAL79_11110 [Nitrososphaeraceae archaeon]